MSAHRLVYAPAPAPRPALQRPAARLAKLLLLAAVGAAAYWLAA